MTPPQEQKQPQAATSSQTPAQPVVTPVSHKAGQPGLPTGLQFKASSFKGPMPPPDYIEAYEKILPGSANRFLQMVEKQSTHRQSMETKTINGINSRATLGIVLAFIIMFALIISGVILISSNHPVTGLSAIIIAAGYIVYTFIVGQKAKPPHPQQPPEVH